jgi:DNA-binding IclR family transcriptional regulator
MMSYVGRKLPAYSTGTGKVFLAHLSEQDLKRFFHSVKMKRFTPKTLTSREALRLELAKIRMQGYAVDWAENEAEVVSVAAPVRDQTGEVVAAVSVAGPVYRISREAMRERIVPEVVRAATMISRRLGYGDSAQPFNP